MSESPTYKRQRANHTPGRGPVWLLCLEDIDLASVPWKTLEEWLHWMIWTSLPTHVSCHHYILFHHSLTRPECLDQLELNRLLFSDSHKDNSQTVLMRLVLFQHFLDQCADPSDARLQNILDTTCETLCQLIRQPRCRAFVDRTNRIGMTALTLVCHTDSFLARFPVTRMDRLVVALLEAGADVHHQSRVCTPFQMIAMVGDGMFNKTADVQRRISHLFDETTARTHALTEEQLVDWTAHLLWRNASFGNPLVFFSSRLHLWTPSALDMLNDESLIPRYAMEQDNEHGNDAVLHGAHLRTMWHNTVPSTLFTAVSIHIIPDLAQLVVDYVCSPNETM